MGLQEIVGVEAGFWANAYIQRCWPFKRRTDGVLLTKTLQRVGL